MGTRALHSGGRAKSFGTKGATATCPKCCGGEDQCCFCVNLDAPPGDPCYPKGFLPPLLCNPVRACCCGSRVRIVGKVRVVQRTDRFDFYTQWQTYWETNDWNLTVALLWHIERAQDGTCKTVFDGTEIVETTRHREFQYGQGDVHVEDSEPDANFNPTDVLRPELSCRPEPYHVWTGMSKFGDGVLPEADYEILDAFIEECTGTASENIYYPPDENQGYEDTINRSYNWSASSTCKKSDILITGNAYRKTVYHPTYDPPYTTFEETRTGTRTASIETVSIENDCCDEDDPGKPFDPAPPIVGATRGNPGFVLVPWAGINWRGVPAPVRVWKWLTRQRYDTRGCGCGDKPKGWWEWLTK